MHTFSHNEAGGLDRRLGRAGDTVHTVHTLGILTDRQYQSYPPLLLPSFPSLSPLATRLPAPASSALAPNRSVFLVCANELACSRVFVARAHAQPRSTEGFG